MNEIEKQQYAALFPRASKSFIDANPHLGLRSEADKPDPRSALGDPVAGKEKGDERIVLSYVLYRVRLLDPDAIDGATKVCTDCLQQIGLIPDDSSKHIDLQVTQEKVAHYSEQRTELKITYP